MKQPDELSLSFVACASNVAVLAQRLLSSPCLQAGGQPLALYVNATSAADGFNAAMTTARHHGVDWLVWLHQDVVLPEGWDSHFRRALAEALMRFPQLAVAGVYGIAGTGAAAQRAGHVLDRGQLLQEPAPLPCLVDSLDELLFAVRVDSGLQLDPTLKFDFYATDVVLQAQAQGGQAAVLDAYCEHWSGTASSGVIAPSVVARIKHSAAVFERKWAAQLPITTPCFEIQRPGDVAVFIDAIVTPVP